MGIKSMLQRWLGINPQENVEIKRLNASNAAQFFTESAIKTQLKPQTVAPAASGIANIRQRRKHKRDTTHKSMVRSRESPKTAKQMYDACGGYEAMRIITSHPKWYKIEKCQRGEYTHVLRVINQYQTSKNNIPESKIMRVKSENAAANMAWQLMDIHVTEIHKRESSNRP